MEERVNAEDFAEMVIFKFCIESIESSQNNCGNIQTEQMKRVFVGILNDTEYADVTEEQVKEFDKRLEVFQEFMKKEKE